MATPNITFGTPNGFEEIAIKLAGIGYGVERDFEGESEDCEDCPKSVLGWRCWNVTLLNSERIFIAECGGDDPMIMINLYSIKDGHQFRDDLLEAGAIEHWDGARSINGFFWNRYYNNYEKRLGSPQATQETH